MHKIGVVSYSIYLNHFSAKMLAMTMVDLEDKVLFILLVSAISILVAIMSTLLVDRYVNRLRNSLRRESNSK